MILRPPGGTPLLPSPDDARSDLRRELLRPEYNEQNILQRIVGWLERLVGETVGAAAGAPLLSTIAACVVLALLALAVAWLVSRARRSGPAAGPQAGVLADVVASAAELRARALAAQAEGRHEEALIDGFRALAARQVERGRIEDRPGATAHEISEVVAAEFPQSAAAVRRSAHDFELVRYGDRVATAAQSAAVLALDDDLAVRR